jgi:hypothetical protein
MLVRGRLTAAADALKPVPVKATLCGLLLASSVMVSVPVRAPRAVGVKVTVTAQLAFAASVAAQLLLCAKSPLMLIPLMLRLAPAVLLRVTVCVAVCPTTIFPKARPAGLADNCPAVTCVPLCAAVVELAGVPPLTAPPHPKFTTQKRAANNGQ